MLKKIIFILVPLILIGSHLSQRIKTWHEAKKEMSNLEANIERLEEEQKSLKEKRNFYQTEEYIRREAREKLGLTDDNELVVVLPDLPDLPNNRIGSRISPDSPTWKQWWDLFFRTN